MIDLNTTPEALQIMLVGSEAALDGHTFKLDAVAGDHPVYLTMTSDISSVRRFGTGYDVLHVRDSKDKVAVMSRTSLMNIIAEKQYIIA